MKSEVLASDTSKADIGLSPTNSTTSSVQLMRFSERLEAGFEAPSLPTIARAIDRGEVMLLSYHKRHEPAVLRAAMVKVFARLYRFYGAYTEDVSERLKLLLDAILSKYWHLTLEDLQRFSERAMQGVYGKVYGQLTPAVVMQWLHEYSLRRDDEIEGMQVDAHNAGRERYEHPEASDQARRALDALCAKAMSR